MNPSAHVDTFTRDNLPPETQWPEFQFTLPELQFPEKLNCGVELLDALVAAGHGDSPAVGMLLDGKPTFATYAQLLAQANRIANTLVHDFQLVPGNRVLLRAPNNPMAAAIWLALMKAGMVAVATMPMLRALELRQVLEKAQIAVALCDVSLREELEKCMDGDQKQYCSLAKIVLFNTEESGSLDTLLKKRKSQFKNVATASDDVCMLSFTSGTTGTPKATMHFHRDVMAMCDTFAKYVLKPNADDIFCGTPPLAFTFGLGGLLCFPLRFGAATLLAERLTPESLLQTIQAGRATICFTAPTFYRQMAMAIKANPSHFSLKSLKKTVSAGEALPDATRHLWKETTGIEMIDGIGGTEVMHIYISASGDDVRHGAVGKVVPGFHAIVVDDQMNPVPFGTVGKLALKGPTGCRYLDDSRQTFYVRNGWNLPGDAFIEDEDGYFYYHARTDDMIITSGYNVAGPEVESVLLTHPAVAECGVVGIADEARGQIVKAFIVLAAGYAPTSETALVLQEFVKAQIAPYKYPRAIEFTEVLPRTDTGKLQRFRLREVG